MSRNNGKKRSTAGLILDVNGVCGAFLFGV